MNVNSNGFHMKTSLKRDYCLKYKKFNLIDFLVHIRQMSLPVFNCIYLLGKVYYNEAIRLAGF